MIEIVQRSFEAFMTMFIILIVYSNISPYKFNIKDNISIILSVIIFYNLIYYINPNLSSITCYILPIFFIYKKSSKIALSIFLQITTLLTIVITDTCIGIISFYIFKRNFETYSLEYYLTCAIILIASIGVSRLIGYILRNYKNFIIENYKSKYALLIYITLIATSIMFYLNINWNVTSDPVNLTRINSPFFIFYAILLVFICYCLFRMIKKDMEYKHEQAQLENLLSYTKNLESLYMDMRKFRHDYLNIIASLSGFIEDNDMEKLKDYFNNHIYPLNKSIESNNYKLGILKNIELTEIKGFISSKLLKAQELGLNVNIEIVDQISHINMDIIDLIRCLGILIDNAMEAAIESAEKELTLCIIKNINSVTIIITNSYGGHLKPLSILFKEGYSSKGKDRGLGLSNLRSTIDKNKNSFLDTSFTNNIFTQTLTIKN